MSEAEKNHATGVGRIGRSGSLLTSPAKVGISTALRQHKRALSHKPPTFYTRGMMQVGGNTNQIDSVRATPLTKMELKHSLVQREQTSSLWRMHRTAEHEAVQRRILSFVLSAAFGETANQLFVP